MNRRSFIAALSSTPLVAGHLSPGIAGERLSAIGLQLYTVRSLMEKTVDGTLSSVAAIGYKEVEFAGYFGRTTEQIRRMLIDNGLTSPATHVGLETDPDTWQEVLGRCLAIGHRYVVVPWIDGSKLTTIDDWKRTAAQFNVAAAAAKSAGLQFVYHNHEFEFHPVEGRIPYEILLEECEPALVQMEMDIAWATAAGADPVRYFEKHPGRFPLLHVKDFTKKKTEGKGPWPQDSAGKKEETELADVGQGVVQWKRILAAARRYGTKHFIVEHDSPADPIASITASFRYLNALTF